MVQATTEIAASELDATVEIDLKPGAGRREPISTTRQMNRICEPLTVAV
jgi:hypothetical protein